MKKLQMQTLVIIDEGTNTFYIIGPVGDDTPWVNATFEAQQKGRRIKCHTSLAARQEVIADLTSQGMTLTETPIIYPNLP